MHQRIKPPLKEVGFPKIQHSDPLSFILNRLRVTHMQFCLFFFERVGGGGGVAVVLRVLSTTYQHSACFLHQIH